MRRKEGECGQFVTGWQWLYFLVFFSEELDYIHIHVAFAPGVSGMGKAFFHVDCYLDDKGQQLHHYRSFCKLPPADITCGW